jgi:serine/threonine-protein kinase
MRASRSSAPDGYELVRPVGRGASGVVWEAVQLSTSRPVALKILNTDISEPSTRRRFEREREVMTGLATHLGIVTIIDDGVQDGRPWLAMEL